MIASFGYIRSLLISALRDATRGLGDLHVVAVASLPVPSVANPVATADWLYMLSGGDGTGGLVLEARLESEAPAASPERRASWRQVYELALGLREVLRELPAAKASCEACGGFRCSACDGRGVVFSGARAA